MSEPTLSISIPDRSIPGKTYTLEVPWGFCENSGVSPNGTVWVKKGTLLFLFQRKDDEEKEDPEDWVCVKISSSMVRAYFVLAEPPERYVETVETGERLKVTSTFYNERNGKVMRSLNLC